jgi:hypothetical protein
VSVGRVRVAAALAALPAGEQAAVEARLRTLRDECGCKSGGVSMLVSALGLAVWAALGNAHGSAGSVALLMVGVLLGSMAVGKAAGVVVARIRFRRLLVAVERKGILAPR